MATNVKYFDAGNIGWNHAHNDGRAASNEADVETIKTLAISIAMNGWDESQPLMGIDADDAAVAPIMEYRAETEKRFAIATEPFKVKTDDGKTLEVPATMLQKATAAMYKRKVQAIGIIGYQRSKALPYAAAIRLAMATAVGKTPEPIMVPVIIRQLTQTELELICIRENVLKTQGLTAVNLHWASLFKMAVVFRNAHKRDGRNFIQSSLLRSFGWTESQGHGRCQKLYPLVSALTYLEKQRIQNPDSHDFDFDLWNAVEDTAKVASFKQADMAILNRALEKGVGVVDTLKEMFSGDVVKAPALPNRKQYETLLNDSPFKLWQMVATCSLTGNFSGLDRLPVPFMQEVNRLFKDYNIPVDGKWTESVDA